MRARIAGLTLLAVLATAACRPKGDAPAPAPDPNTPVPVEIESHFQGDVTIYLVRGNLNQRLGRVSGLGTAEFTFPWRWLGNGGGNRLLAQPLAGARSYLSEQLNVQPGQWIKWTLEADLGRSSLSIY